MELPEPNPDSFHPAAPQTGVPSASPCLEPSASERPELPRELSDRELLEKAAKAAGVTDARWEDGAWLALRYDVTCGLYSDAWGYYWNPLESDGDALRLAVTLGFLVDVRRDDKTYVACDVAPLHLKGSSEAHGDPYAATRRAIVRAAAALDR
jgi:hypothetical protein